MKRLGTTKAAMSGPASLHRRSGTTTTVIPLDKERTETFFALAHQRGVSVETLWREALDHSYAYEMLGPADKLEIMVESPYRELIRFMFHISGRQQGQLADKLGWTAPEHPTMKRLARSWVIARRTAIFDKRRVLSYSRMIIGALEETLTYNPGPHNNNPPPGLWIDDSNYIEELRNLVSELRRLNDLLESRKKPAGVQKTVASFGNHAERFLKNYSASFGKMAGKGSWYLLVGTIGALLYHAGAGQGLGDSILSQIKTLR
jgi:hypothetical protein